MIAWITVLKLWLFSFLFCLAQSMTVFGQTPPMDQMKQTVGRVVEILQAPGSDGSAAKAERRQMIREVLLPRFDFAEMAKRTLGAHWKNQNGRQEEFVSVFADYVENSYLSTLEGYKGEKVRYLRERVEQNLAQVDTQLVAATRPTRSKIRHSDSPPQTNHFDVSRILEMCQFPDNHPRTRSRFVSIIFPFANSQFPCRINLFRRLVRLLLPRC